MKDLIKVREESYNEGREDGYRIGVIGSTMGDVKAEVEIENIKIAERKKIIKWANAYMEADKKIYGTDKHGIDLEDLTNFIKSL